jgi:hypothetical protein
VVEHEERPRLYLDAGSAEDERRLLLGLSLDDLRELLDDLADPGVFPYRWLGFGCAEDEA